MHFGNSWWCFFFCHCCHWWVGQGEYYKTCNWGGKILFQIPNDVPKFYRVMTEVIIWTWNLTLGHKWIQCYNTLNCPLIKVLCNLREEWFLFRNLPRSCQFFYYHLMFLNCQLNMPGSHCSRSSDPQSNFPYRYKHLTTCCYIVVPRNLHNKISIFYYNLLFCLFYLYLTEHFWGFNSSSLKASTWHTRNATLYIVILHKSFWIFIDKYFKLYLESVFENPVNSLLDFIVINLNHLSM